MRNESKTRQNDCTVQPKKLRLWPGIVAALLLVLTKFIIPNIIPDTLAVAMFGGLISGLLIIIWWVFFSRSFWIERLGAVLLMVVAMIAVRPLLHQSIAEAGMGMLFPILAIPILALAFVVWAVLTQKLSNTIRRLTMVVTILIGVGWWTLILTGGINNDGKSDFSWRWGKTPEEKLLSQAEKQTPITLPDSTFMLTESKWPGFRGATRDGVVRGVQIKTDWTTFPPVELWRQSVGPGWSSFSVWGDLIYTQEQRGEDEVVSCYNRLTGELLWKHSDETRFWESNGGAGPRATPTLKDGRVYALGATGILNVLDALDGSVIWSRNAGQETETKVPIWGFSGSPLIVDNIVIASVAGSLVAYDITTGNLRWSHKVGGDCYSSPHLMELDNVKQVLLQNEAGVFSVLPADGSILWTHDWPGNPIVQPTLLPSGDLLVSIDDRSGIRRLSVENKADGWTAKEQWTSEGVRPYFNDSVIHKDHVYGFDGRSLACISLKDGERKWKGGKYGRGQFILLADQDLILVISEKGDLALVNAVSEKYTEIARIPALQGKTWNHPVLVDDILLIRNAAEMAAFKLALQNG